MKDTNIYKLLDAIADLAVASIAFKLSPQNSTGTDYGSAQDEVLELIKKVIIEYKEIGDDALEPYFHNRKNKGENE